MEKELQQLVNELISSEEFNQNYEKCKTDTSKKNLFLKHSREFETKHGLEDKSLKSKKVQLLYLETKIAGLKNSTANKKKTIIINKKTAYDGMVNMAKKTGQGVPYELFRNNKPYLKYINELIEEDKLKIVKGGRTSIPTVILTEGYVSEEDKDPRGLLFVRYYLGQNDIFGRLKLNNKKYEGKTQREILMLDCKKEYDKWLKENQEKLDITKSL